MRGNLGYLRCCLLGLWGQAGYRGAENSKACCRFDGSRASLSPPRCQRAGLSPPAASLEEPEPTFRLQLRPDLLHNRA